ncbi:MAG: hypothetical protein HC831_09935 [Chloroflexia bacterium]|nr:hypothetical protein [Chloroflexia bacterium]
MARKTKENTCRTKKKREEQKKKQEEQQKKREELMQKAMLEKDFEAKKKPYLKQYMQIGYTEEQADSLASIMVASSIAQIEIMKQPMIGQDFEPIKKRT